MDANQGDETKVRCSDYQINTFTDEAGNDVITLSQYTCVRGGIRRGAVGRGGQTKREITKSHSLLGISEGPGS